MDIRHAVFRDNLSITELNDYIGTVVTRNKNSKTKQIDIDNNNEAEKSTLKTSLHIGKLGSRYLTVAGYSGYIYLDELANRVNEIIKSNYHFLEEDRFPGQDLTEKIKYLYRESNRLIEGSLITKIIVYIRSLFSYRSTENFWREIGCAEYLLYTQEQATRLKIKVDTMVFPEKYKYEGAPDRGIIVENLTGSRVLD